MLPSASEATGLSMWLRRRGSTAMSILPSPTRRRSTDSSSAASGGASEKSGTVNNPFSGRAYNFGVEGRLQDWIAALRPSTAPLRQAQGRAQDEVISLCHQPFILTLSLARSAMSKGAGTDLPHFFTRFELGDETTMIPSLRILARPYLLALLGGEPMFEHGDLIAPRIGDAERGGLTVKPIGGNRVARCGDAVQLAPSEHFDRARLVGGGLLLEKRDLGGTGGLGPHF